MWPGLSSQEAVKSAPSSPAPSPSPVRYCLRIGQPEWVEGETQTTRLEVPLDWTNTSNPNTAVQAIGVLPSKVKTSDANHGKTIFIEFAGPGDSGLELLRNLC